MRALFLCALLGGCAAAPPPPKPAPAPVVLTIGKTTKADVRASLGEATIVDFASGYEVWVYRHKEAELVLLFEPSGILAKTRQR